MVRHIINDEILTKLYCFKRQTIVIRYKSIFQKILIISSIEEVLSVQK